MGKRWGLLLAFLLAMGLSVSGVALAHPDHDDCGTNTVSDSEGVIDSAVEAAQTANNPCAKQHDGDEGHLPPRQSNVRVIGKAPIDTPVPGRVADVGVFKEHAYLAAFNEPDCQRGGVYVFDIKNPKSPSQVGFIEAAGGTYVGEGVQTIHVDTRRYEGDLLIHNNEICGTPEPGLPNGGISLVDVSDPKAPEKLAEGVGDFEPEGINGPDVAHTVHSAFAWQADNGAYAVLVDNEEGADVDIMNISDPRNPRIVAEYDLNEQFPQIAQEDLGTDESFFHDVIVKKINGRQVMLLSYWDGGYVKLDVTDPTNATYLADSDFNNPDPEALESGLTVEPEGNAHQAEFSLKNNFIVAADEDFSPYSVEARNVTQNNEEFDATQGGDTPQIDSDTSLTGETVFVGRACNDDPPVQPGDGTQVAVVERGVCAFTDKVANVERAGGYVGVIVMNAARPDGCSDLLNMSVQGNIPALFVGRDTGFEFFGADYDEEACRTGDSQAPEIGTRGDTIKVEAVFDGWGYVHLFANGAGKLRELDTYAIPEAHDRRFAEDFGDLSVHEVAMSRVRNDLAYFSYYSGGFRVARIANGKLVETGSFIDEGGNNFWGVQTFKHEGRELVAASDRDYGLYIFRYTGN